MYFTDIANKKALKFNNSVRITANYDELNELSDGKLFNTEQAMRLIPMFYCDEIVGFSENLTIIDDLIVLYINKTVNGQTENELNQLYFNSEDQERIFKIYHELETVNNKHYLKLHFYDKTSLFSLSSFKFKIIQSDNGITGEYETDLYGNCIIPLNSIFGSFSVISDTLNQTVIFGEDE